MTQLEKVIIFRYKQTFFVTHGGPNWPFRCLDCCGNWLIGFRVGKTCFWMVITALLFLCVNFLSVLFCTLFPTISNWLQQYLTLVQISDQLKSKSFTLKWKMENSEVQNWYFRAGAWTVPPLWLNCFKWHFAGAVVAQTMEMQTRLKNEKTSKETWMELNLLQIDC